MTAVADLAGADLALWVARAVKYEVLQESGKWTVFVPFEQCWRSLTEHGWRPDRDWSVGGPLLEQFNIQVSPPTSHVHRYGGQNAGNGQAGVWTACTWTRGADGRRALGMDDHGALPAAMRCIVRFHYGVDVPDANAKGGA